MARRGRSRAGLLAYLGRAFLFRWNLLFFFGAAAAAALSPAPDVLLPLVGAAELTYLGALTSMPRFRAAVDAASADLEGDWRPEARKEASFPDLLRGLSRARRDRFLALRGRCLDMRRIADGVKGRAAGGSEADDLRTPALDRMLWVFIRLLHSQQALQHFLSATDEGALRTRLASLEKRHTSLGQGRKDRLLRSITDSIATTRLRLENCRTAKENAEFVNVELDRIEGKIQALTEMAVGHQDPDLISSQVDSVSESMRHAESAIRELDQITGLREDLQEPPAILDAPLAEAEG